MTIRRKRVILPAAPEPDEHAAEGDADKRSPRVFRLTRPAQSGEVQAGNAGSPSGEAPLGEVGTQDGLGLPPSSPLQRRGRAARSPVASGEHEIQRADEAALLSQEATLTNRINALTDCAQALRELQQRRVAEWEPLHARVESIRTGIERPRPAPISCESAPSVGVASELLIQLRELARKLDLMRQFAGNICGISAGRDALAKRR